MVTLLAAVGLTAQPSSAALAATGVTQGRITIDEPNPIKEITLSPGSQMQLNSRTMDGNAFYVRGGLPDAYPILFDLGKNVLMKRGVDGTQTHGGTGTVADPFVLETRGPLADEYAMFTLTQRLTYVLGAEYVQSDLTLENTGANETHVQLGQYADCTFKGSDKGLSALHPDSMVQCLNGANAISLVGVSPGAKFAGGHFGGVKTALEKSFMESPSADKCWVSSTVTGACDTDIDNGFGMAWDLTLAGGAQATRSAYISYASALAMVDLDVDAQVSSTEIELGEAVTYALQVSNGGPDTAENVAVAFALPEGMAWVSDTGDYDPESGVWAISSLPEGQSEHLEVTVRPVIAGQFSTRITAVSSQGIDQDPCQATGSCGPELTVFVDDSGFAATSAITAAPAEVLADGEESATITITAKNRAGEPATTGGGNVTLSTTFGDLGAVTDHGNGTYTADLVSSRAGSAVISFTMHGIEAPATTSVSFFAGPTDPSNAETRFTVSTGALPVGDAPHTVRVQLVDRTGNPVTGAAERLRASTDDPLGAGEIGSFSELAEPGSYEARVTSTSAGSKELAVHHDGTAISADGNRVAAFAPGDVDLSGPGTGFTVSDAVLVAGSGNHTVSVALSDEYGNAISGLAAELTAATTASLGAGEVGPFLETDRAGYYEASVSSTRAGEKPLTVGLGTHTIPTVGNDTARFIPGDVDLSRSETGYRVSEGDASVSGGSHAVTVTLVDAFGNPIPGQAAELSAATDGPLGGGAITEFAETTEPGEYRAALTSTVAGEKAVTATVAGAALSAPGNATAWFVAGGVDTENPGTGYIVTEGSREVGGETHTVTVTLVDEFGNPVSGQAAGLSGTVEAGLGDGAVGAFVESAETPGSYMAQVGSTEAGLKPIQVAFGGGAVTLRGNGEAVFVPGAVDTAHARSAYGVSEGARIVDSDPHTVTVTLVDRYGNGVSGEAARLSASSVESLGSGEITAFTDLGDGVYAAEVSSTRAGSKTITAAWGSVAIVLSRNGVAEFYSDNADPEHPDTTFAVTSGLRTVGAETHTVTVQLADRFGNPVSGTASELAIATASELGGARPGVFAEAEVAGVYQAILPSHSAGDKLIVVGLWNTVIRPDGNDIARFIAGPADLSQTTLEAPERLRADGVDSGPVTVALFDSFGNPSDAVDTVEITSSLGELGSQTQPNAGQFRASLSSKEPGTAVVGALVDGEIAPVTAEVVFDRVSGGTEPGGEDQEGGGLPPTGGPALWGGGILGLLLLALGVWRMLRTRRVTPFREMGR